MKAKFKASSSAIIDQGASLVSSFELFAGPTLNLLATEQSLNQEDHPSIREAFGPSALTETTSDDILYEGWIRGNLGIRYQELSPGFQLAYS